MIPGASQTKGRLLVATPPLDDPNFDRTVVYVIEHHTDGALGVVINRPTDEPLGEPLDRWDDLQARPGSVFQGGPVEPDALIALALANLLLTAFVGIHPWLYVTVGRCPASLVLERFGVARTCRW